MTYYEITDGIKYDKAILDIARKSILGQGDGRLSINDVKEMVSKILDKKK